MTDQEKIQRLESQGYTVELFNPDGQEFNQKYVVYKAAPKAMGFGNDIPMNKIVVIDAGGNVVGAQG